MTFATAAQNATPETISKPADALSAYEQRFGSLPDWLNDVPPGRTLSLLRQALHRGAPLTAADYLH